MSGPNLHLPTGGFCNAVWSRTRFLQEAILTHPFNEALAAGTLEVERFTFYLVQDARYLVGFSRALSVASTRTWSAEDAAFLADCSHTALVVERSLHAAFLQEHGIVGEALRRFPTSPSCLAYSSYLQATALADPFPVLAAALLPCFWIYQLVGSDIDERTRTVPGHPYRRWIDTYSDEAFAERVGTMRDIVERAAHGAGTELVEAMVAAFCRSSELEWMFWDSAWRMERWETARWLETAPR